MDNDTPVGGAMGRSLTNQSGPGHPAPSKTRRTVLRRQRRAPRRSATGGPRRRRGSAYWLRWTLVAWLASGLLWTTVTGEADLSDMFLMAILGWLIAPKPPAPPEPPRGPVVPSARTTSRLWWWATMFTAVAVPLAVAFGGRVAGPLVFWCAALVALWMFWRAARASRSRRQAPWIS